MWPLFLVGLSLGAVAPAGSSDWVLGGPVAASRACYLPNHTYPVVSNCCNESDIFFCLPHGCFTAAGCAVCSENVCWEVLGYSFSARPGGDARRARSELFRVTNYMAWGAYFAGALGLGEVYSSMVVVGLVLGWVPTFQVRAPLQCGLICPTFVPAREGAFWETLTAVQDVVSLLASLPRRLAAFLLGVPASALVLVALLALEGRVVMALALLAGGVTLVDGACRIPCTPPVLTMNNVSCVCDFGLYIRNTTNPALSFPTFTCPDRFEKEMSVLCGWGSWWWYHDGVQRVYSHPQMPPAPISAVCYVSLNPIVWAHDIKRIANQTSRMRTDGDDDPEAWPDSSLYIPIKAKDVTTCVLDRRPSRCGPVYSDGFYHDGRHDRPWALCGAGTLVGPIVFTPLFVLNGTWYNYPWHKPSVEGFRRNAWGRRRFERLLWGYGCAEAHGAIHCWNCSLPELKHSWWLLPGKPTPFCMSPRSTRKVQRWTWWPLWLFDTSRQGNHPFCETSYSAAFPTCNSTAWVPSDGQPIVFDKGFQVFDKAHHISLGPLNTIFFFLLVVTKLAGARIVPAFLALLWLASWERVGAEVPPFDWCIGATCCNSRELVTAANSSWADAPCPTARDRQTAVACLNWLMGAGELSPFFSMLAGSLDATCDCQDQRGWPLEVLARVPPCVTLWVMGGPWVEASITASLEVAVASLPCGWAPHFPTLAPIGFTALWWRVGGATKAPVVLALVGLHLVTHCEGHVLIGSWDNRTFLNLTIPTEDLGNGTWWREQLGSVRTWAVGWWSKVAGAPVAPTAAPTSASSVIPSTPTNASKSRRKRGLPGVDAAIGPWVLGAPALGWAIRLEGAFTGFLGVLAVVLYYRVAGVARLAPLVALKLAGGYLAAAFMILFGGLRYPSVSGYRLCIDFDPGELPDWDLTWALAALVSWAMVSLAALTPGGKRVKVRLYRRWLRVYTRLVAYVEFSCVSSRGRYATIAALLWSVAGVVWPEATGYVATTLVLLAGTLDLCDWTFCQIITAAPDLKRFAAIAETLAQVGDLPRLRRWLEWGGSHGLWLYDHMGQVPPAVAAALREADGCMEPARFGKEELGWLRDDAFTLACGHTAGGRPVVARCGGIVLVGHAKSFGSLPPGFVLTAPLVVRRAGRGFFRVMLTSATGRDTNEHSGNVMVLGTAMTRSCGTIVDGMLYTTFHSSGGRPLAGPHGPQPARWVSASEDVAVYPAPRGTSCLARCSCGSKSVWAIRNDSALCHGELGDEGQLTLDVCQTVKHFKGSSGSPILCDQGHAVGMLVAVKHRGAAVHAVRYVVPWKMVPADAGPMGETQTPPPVGKEGTYTETGFFGPTGSGKTTKLPAAYVSQGYKVLVLNPSVMTTRSMLTYMKEKFGISPSVYCGSGSAAVTRTTDTGLTYATYGRFLAKPDQLLRGADIVICDECHSLDAVSILGMGAVRRFAKQHGVRLVLFATATPPGCPVQPHKNIREERLDADGDIPFYGLTLKSVNYAKGRHVIFSHSKAECKRLSEAFGSLGIAAVAFWRGVDPGRIPPQGDVVVCATDALMTGYSGNFDSVTDCNTSVIEVVEVDFQPTFSIGLKTIPSPADVRIQRRGRCGRGRQGVYRYIMEKTPTSGLVPSGAVWAAVETGMAWYRMEPNTVETLLQLYASSPYTGHISCNIKEAVGGLLPLAPYINESEVVKAAARGWSWPLLVGVQRRECIRSGSGPPSDSEEWEGISGDAKVPLLYRVAGSPDLGGWVSCPLTTEIARGLGDESVTETGCGPILLVGCTIAAAVAISHATGSLVVVECWDTRGGGAPVPTETIDYGRGGAYPQGPSILGGTEAAADMVEKCDFAVWRALWGELASGTAEAVVLARDKVASWMASSQGGRLPSALPEGVSFLSLPAGVAFERAWLTITGNLANLVTMCTAAWASGRNPPLAVMASALAGLQHALPLDTRLAAAMLVGAVGTGLGTPSTGAAMAVGYTVGNGLGSYSVLGSVLAVLTGYEAVVSGAKLSMSILAGDATWEDAFFAMVGLTNPGTLVAGFCVGALLHFATCQPSTDLWLNRLLTMLPKGGVLPDNYFVKNDLSLTIRTMLGRISLVRAIATICHSEESTTLTSAWVIMRPLWEWMSSFVSALYNWALDRVPSVKIPLYSCQPGWKGHWIGTGVGRSACPCGAIVQIVVECGEVKRLWCNTKKCRSSWLGGFPINTTTTWDATTDAPYPKIENPERVTVKTGVFSSVVLGRTGDALMILESTESGVRKEEVREAVKQGVTHVDGVAVSRSTSHRSRPPSFGKGATINLDGAFVTLPVVYGAGELPTRVWGREVVEQPVDVPADVIVSTAVELIEEAEAKVSKVEARAALKEEALKMEVLESSLEAGKARKARAEAEVESWLVKKMLGMIGKKELLKDMMPLNTGGSGPVEDTKPVVGPEELAAALRGESPPKVDDEEILSAWKKDEGKWKMRTEFKNEVIIAPPKWETLDELDGGDAPERTTPAVFDPFEGVVPGAHHARFSTWKVEVPDGKESNEPKVAESAMSDLSSEPDPNDYEDFLGEGPNEMGVFADVGMLPPDDVVVDLVEDLAKVTPPVKEAAKSLGKGLRRAASFGAAVVRAGGGAIRRAVSSLDVKAAVEELTQDYPMVDPTRDRHVTLVDLCGCIIGKKETSLVVPGDLTLKKFARLNGAGHHGHAYLVEGKRHPSYTKINTLCTSSVVVTLVQHDKTDQPACSTALRGYQFIMRCCDDKSVRRVMSDGIPVDCLGELLGWPKDHQWATPQGDIIDPGATLGELGLTTLHYTCKGCSETKCGASYLWYGVPLNCGLSKQPPITRPIGTLLRVSGTKGYITDMRDVGLRVDKVTKEQTIAYEDKELLDAYNLALANAKRLGRRPGWTYEEAAAKVRPNAAPGHNVKLSVADVKSGRGRKVVEKCYDSILTGAEAHPFMLTAKQEVFPQDKETRKPPRLICYPSLEFRVCEKMIMGNPGEVAKAVLGEAYGFQYTPMERVKVMEKLWKSYVRPGVIEVDATCFDSTITQQDVARETEIYAAASANPEAVRALGNYYAGGPMINRQGVVVGERRCRASGVLTTSASNSITCWIKVSAACRKAGIKNPKFLIHGDDTLIFFEREDNDPTEALGKALRGYGYEATPTLHASLDTAQTCSSWYAECRTWGGVKHPFLSCDMRRALVRASAEYGDPLAAATGYTLQYPCHPIVRFVLLPHLLSVIHATGGGVDSVIGCKVGEVQLQFPLSKLPGILVRLHGPGCLRVVADSTKTLAESAKVLQFMEAKGLNYFRRRTLVVKKRLIQSSADWARLAKALLWSPAGGTVPPYIEAVDVGDLPTFLASPYEGEVWGWEKPRARHWWKVGITLAFLILGILSYIF